MLKQMGFTALAMVWCSSMSTADTYSDFFCNVSGPEPTLEESRPYFSRTMVISSVPNILALANQCGHQTDDYADLLFRAVDAVGCSNTSTYYKFATAIAAQDISTNYKMKVAYERAVEQDEEAVAQICEEVSQLDPTAVDVMDEKAVLEFAQESGRLTDEVWKLFVAR